MKKLRYSPDYKEKIAEMRKYLDLQFGADTRKAVFKEINKRVQALRKYENSGIAVKDVFAVNTEYKYIYVAKNYLFYRNDEDEIYIAKIYDEREDFMWKMFGIKTTTQETENYWED